MDLTVTFYFRNKVYKALAYFSFDEEPCYIFTLLQNPELIYEFGEEITIKTDCNVLLPKKDDYTELVELRQAIFNAVKITRAFEFVRVQYSHLINSTHHRY